MQATVDDIWGVFRAFLEDPNMKKAWHNYSFDRHVLGNVRAGGQPIRAAGFHADTMHMARLWDASRKGKGYSLEALSGCALPPPSAACFTCLPGHLSGVHQLDTLRVLACSQRHACLQEMLGR